MPSTDAPHNAPLTPPETGDDWLGLSSDALPTDVASTWVVRPDCGATVTFCGTTRDHSEGRPGVHRLDYEAYAEHVVPRLEQLAAEMRNRWPDLARIVMLHRIGTLGVGDVAVVVAVSSPHRAVAFDAARFGIDTLKSTVPIWKKEVWDDGESWGLEAQHVGEVGTT